MSVDDSGPARAAAGRQNQERSIKETPTVFERAARQQAARNQEENVNKTPSIFERRTRQPATKNQGRNPNRTSSIFEGPARQQAAKNQEENANRTSSIFEGPPQQQAAKNHAERVQAEHTPPTTDDKTKHDVPFEAGPNLSRERGLNDNQGGSVLVPHRSTVGQLEPEQDGPHMSSVTEAQLIGRTLANKYTIESVIGTGSMGTVYRARQIALDKWVAVKILHRDLAEERNFVERFKLEAFSASRVEHPNFLRVLDFGEDGNLLHLVMEYVQADDLFTVMQREWPFEDVRIVQIMSQALAALAKAHELGIVHRDIKPENILILRETDDEGNATEIVKVCDFGIAKLATPPTPQSRPFAHNLTTAGLIVGTPDYMSPEQARGEGVDGRSDLYAMGVVLYHLLSGRPPFIADTPVGLAIQHVSEPPPPPSRYCAVNPVLESICLRAMNKRPEDRFQTAREMRRALLSALPSDAESEMTSSSGSAASTAREVRHSPSAPRKFNWPRRPHAMIAAAALVTVVTVVASVISRRRGQESSWSSGNVVRTTTVALAPAPLPQANTASPEASNRVPTPPPVAGSESELRARRPVAAPSPAPQR